LVHFILHKKLEKVDVTLYDHIERMLLLSPASNGIQKNNMPLISQYFSQMMRLIIKRFIPQDLEGAKVLDNNARGNFEWHLD
jgi:hypothetical protein